MSATEAANLAASIQERVQVVCSNPDCPQHVVKRQRSSRTWADTGCKACGSAVKLASTGGESVTPSAPANPPAATVPPARPYPVELADLVKVAPQTYRLLRERGRDPVVEAGKALDLWAVAELEKRKAGS